MNEAEPKPKRARRRYDEAFRRNAVALLENSGRSLKQIAAELGGLTVEPARPDKEAWAQQTNLSSNARRNAAGDGTAAPRE
jgi:hypothetical protein